MANCWKEKSRFFHEKSQTVTMRCPVCGKIFSFLSKNHLKYKHNMTMQEFREKYPEMAWAAEGATKL